MSAADNRRSMELAFEAFNRRDFDEVRATAADDYVDHEAPPELGSGFDATQRNVGRMIEAFPDVPLGISRSSPMSAAARQECG